MGFIDKIIGKIQYWKNRIAYKRAISTPLVKAQINNPFSIPILIINYNQLFFLKQQVDFLVGRGFHNIVIIDNLSDYPPLLAYYNDLPKGVIAERMDKNYGHMVFFESDYLQEKYGKGYYVVSDADIVPNQSCPANFMSVLINQLNKHFQNITKVGFALRIDDIPDSYALKKNVHKWEQKFWENELEKDVFAANIDTTFALYKPNYPSSFFKLPFLAGLRIAGDFTAKHGGWYLDVTNPSAEMLHYQKTASASNSWKMDASGDIKGDFKGTY
ncbi:hypothetical protein DBR32_03765 [Taibaiella sp. KBW10]|uniref:hypothetical protein n=1 Tax=Taibaiella sp. KBW10 TaxID=2153357 RepID=UPI000F599085|nr:hypothetical protein [Taibaiella sp. KBW10]RQO31933.1 hypothetical protein DBR32_03765 [Taibaiella sp. KBW10]